ncbi:MAG: hypothetical protein ACR2PT_18060 [Endozoicomonas sp.]
MYAMSGGVVVNLVLDYFFVIEFGWGMAGAALATGISQVLFSALPLPTFSVSAGT